MPCPGSRDVPDPATVVCGGAPGTKCIAPGMICIAPCTLCIVPGTICIASGMICILNTPAPQHARSQYTRSRYNPQCARTKYARSPIRPHPQYARSRYNMHSSYDRLLYAAFSALVICTAPCMQHPCHSLTRHAHVTDMHTLLHMTYALYLVTHSQDMHTSRICTRCCT